MDNNEEPAVLDRVIEIAECVCEYAEFELTKEKGQQPSKELP